MRVSDADQRLVARSLDLARGGAAAAPADIPVGALVVTATGEIVAQAVNRREADQDPTAHAEVLALRAAGQSLGTWRLTGLSLVVSLEPCPMCAGAAVSARVARILFGAWNPDYGACGSVWDLPRDRHLNHRPEVIGGVLAEESAIVVRDFFEGRRG